MTLEQIESEALKLSDDARAQLVESLLCSLGQAQEADQEWVRWWAEEARRRDKAIESGREEEIPAQQVFDRIQARLEK